MGWPKNIVFVRHAESEGNVLNVNERAKSEIATHAYKLTDVGRVQAAATRDYLRENYSKFDVRYVSYYARARETMEIIQPGLKTYEDPRLAEAQRGIYHTMTHEEIEKYYPGELVRKEREGLYHYRPWGGENWPDVEMRIHSFFGTLARDCVDKNVLVVVHGHWLMLAQRLIHHFSIEEAIEKYKQGVFKNASVTHYVGEPVEYMSSRSAEPVYRLRLVQANIAPWEKKHV